MLEFSEQELQIYSHSAGMQSYTISKLKSI